ncbi:MAG: hypothetical protein E7105_00115 [Prevotella sp.]|nr:hypothetical protein [Prevotella sp.]
MKKIFISHTFWVVYSILYFILMMAACIIAEGHMVGGGGNSDSTLHIWCAFAYYIRWWRALWLNS